MALITAGAIGLVIANEATIAGSQGGCQAECGSAAAMTAAALVELSGGANDMAAQACAIAIKNQLGLTCDPVAGLVEVPCVKRNAGGIVIAISAADMALAGIKSVIPVDEVIAAMREIGESMPSSLRETAQGGLATTPTGLALKEKIFGSASGVK
jgi:L-serine dehydratase